MKEIDSCCSLGHQPYKINEPAREQKNSDNYKSKSQKQKNPAPQCFDSAETFEKAWKEKKKNNKKKKRDY